MHGATATPGKTTVKVHVWVKVHVLGKSFVLKLMFYSNSCVSIMSLPVCSAIIHRVSTSISQKFPTLKIFEQSDVLKQLFFGKCEKFDGVLFIIH